MTCHLRCGRGLKEASPIFPRNFVLEYKIQRQEGVARYGNESDYFYFWHTSSEQNTKVEQAVTGSEGVR